MKLKSIDAIDCQLIFSLKSRVFKIWSNYISSQNRCHTHTHLWLFFPKNN